VNPALLAPACTFDLFQVKALSHPQPFNNFRMFALGDALEAGYWEVRYVYPRSLLYMVAGMFERDPNGDGAFDRPLLGMERYHDAARYPAPSLQVVRQFLAAAPNRAVWSKAALGPGLGCDSDRHGGFFLDPTGQPPAAMRSVLHLLSQP
jgi:hypothetical protein